MNNEPQKHEIFKIIFAIIVSGLLTIFAILALLPLFISTHWGNQLTTQLINSQIAGKVAFKGLNTSWTGEQKIEGLQLYDENGQEIATVNSVISDTPLWTLLLSQGKKGEYEISGMNAQIVQQPDGSTNLQQALSKKNHERVSNTEQTPLSINLSDVNIKASLANDTHNAFKISGKTAQGNLQGSFDADVSLGALTNQLDTEQLEKIHAQANVVNFPVSLIDDALGLKGLLVQTLGEKLNLNIVNLKDVKQPTIQINVSADKLQADPLYLSVKPDLNLIKPANIRLAIPASLVNQLALNQSKIKLTNNLPLNMQISQFVIPEYSLHSGAPLRTLSDWIVALKLQIDQVALSGLPDLGDVRIQNVNATVHGDSLKNAVVNLTASLSPSQQNVTFQQLLGNQADFSLASNLQVHNTDDIDFSTFTAEFKSPSTQAKINGKLDDFQKLTLTSPAVINYNLTHGAIAALGLNNLQLDNGSQVQLIVDETKEPIDLSDVDSLRLKGHLKVDQIYLQGNSGSIRQLSLPWEVNLPNNTIALQLSAITNLNSGKNEGAIAGNIQVTNWIKNGVVNLRKAGIQSHLNMDKLVIINSATGAQATLVDIQGVLNSPQIDRNLQFNFSGKHGQNQGQLYPFQIKGSANNILNADGKLDEDNLTLNLDSQLEQFPVKILTQFVGLGNDFAKRIAALIGEKINANIHMQIDHLQGPVVINVNGDNGSLSLDSFVRNGYLTLNKNFTTQVKMTEELGRVVLDEIFPLAGGLLGSDNPLTIHVGKEGFVLPIKNFNVSQVKVGKASLELGKVLFRSDGQLGSIFRLFNTSSSDKISVWFTPLYVSMNNGRININRIDMLIMDHYPIATWGTVDFVADRVNMMIGLTGKALINGFNLSGLGKDYMMQIPFQGTIANASIDRKRAAAKIAAMVASTRGPEGALIGAALHVASGGLTEGKAPAPTTNPLPWSVEGDDAQPAQQTKDKSSKKTPIHQVEDKASKILKNILPF